MANIFTFYNNGNKISIIVKVSLYLLKYLAMLKTCPYSGLQFNPTRKNQIFATAKHRRDYHNATAADIRKLKSPIDRALEKNFIILSEKLQAGETKVFSKEDLLISGFNPTFFTHLILYDGKTSRCLYHFVLPKSDNPNTITVIYPSNDRPN
jgi:hypothetical protein